MVTFKEMDKTCFEMYDQVTQNVEIKSEYRIKRVDNGLGGLLLEIKGGFTALHERITYQHLVFEVNEVDKRRIVKIKTIVKQ